MGWGKRAWNSVKTTAGAGGLGALVNPVAIAPAALAGAQKSGAWDVIKDGFKGLKGGGMDVDPHSTLTPEQQIQLKGLTAYNIENYPQMFSALGSLAYNPESNYSKIGNWEGEFNAGVFNPAMNQMNKMIDNTRHSSNLHSSANRYAQDQLRQGLSDQLAGLRYDQLMKERSMQLQGLDDAQQRQMSALGALNNLSGQALGVNGVENIVNKKRDWMDYASLGISGLSALGGLAGAGAGA